MSITLNQNKALLVSKQAGGDGIGIKFLEKTAFKNGLFESVSLNQTSRSSIILLHESGLNGPYSYVNPSYVIQIGIRKGSNFVVVRENAPRGTVETVWENAQNSIGNIGWPNPYRLEGIGFSCKDGKERIGIIGSDGKERTEFGITARKESMLGIAGIEVTMKETGRGASPERHWIARVQLYSINDPGTRWLPFPMNQSDDVLLL